MPDKGCQKRTEGKNTTEAETISLRKSRLVTLTRFPELKGTARWMAIMKQFTETHKDKCYALKHEHPKVHRTKTTHLTGSTYEGTWNVLGMSGQGVYTYPREGVIYDGQLDDGEFHGDGELRYKDGATLKGVWKHGKVMDQTLFFDGDVEYSPQNWKYCVATDRRFATEYDKGLHPSGRTFMTQEQPSRVIPPGWFDVGYGFYDPTIKSIFKYDNFQRVIKFPEKRMQVWIENTCRASSDLPVEPFSNFEIDLVMPSLEIEIPPKPQVTKKSSLENDNSAAFLELDHRSTSRLCMGKQKRLSIRSCGGSNFFCIPSSLGKSELKNKFSYSDSALAASNPATKTDKMVFDSIHCLLTHKGSNLINPRSPLLSVDKKPTKDLRTRTSAKKLQTGSMYE